MTNSIDRRGLLTGALVAMALTACGSQGVRAQATDPAARRIESYYQQLLPTIRQASALSVRERARRFSPAILGAFDLGTMTRLATGPEWSRFSGSQQAAVREAFGQFIVADYASQIDNYSGESFQVEPTTEVRGGDRIVKSKILKPGGSAVTINYLMRGARVIDVYLNGTVSDLATRRDEFASILASGGGAEALIRSMREKTQRLLGG
ncbi:MAG: ABC transporter substrate-binding protein [Methylobacteriaceae bacterium]|nr:ABC transporter substrate-binding protein [Methylobacteriaceae bacterium]MBV9633849.1 ABC transporter substrate-binding protein [Methylobacteriaceae bacterium]MBV9704945.1 ABC transporter substrate-binding protein [Methylobacteriaceae bacterium]